MSWKAEVKTNSIEPWAGNGLRFETREQAERYARDLSWRWLAVTDWRVVECNDPVTEVQS